MGLRREIRRLFGIGSPRRQPSPHQMPDPAKLRDEGYVLPNFFIAGTARAGTTSLWEYLRQHPDIYMPPVFELKEPSFFCDSYGIKDWKQYLELFAEGRGRKMIGEASGPYLTSPESPARIREAFPEARFIISLRNPADRAFSKYKWMRANRFESAPSFEEALKLEESRAASDDFRKNNGQYFYNFLYFQSGRYVEQVRRFFETFGREQVRVVIFEEWTRQPLETVREIFSFLGVDAQFAPQIQVYNATTKDSAFDASLRAELLQRYKDDIRQLEKLLGRELETVWT
jgi:hypothetical protein